MKDSQAPDFYKLLGLTADTTPAEIKARYRILSKQHHPDKGGSQTDMAKLNHAYSVLSDKFKRAIYDAERRRLQQVRRRPAPRSASHFTKQKRRKSWWPKLAFGFASLVIMGGLLLHLPIAEAITSTTGSNDQQATTSLDFTYPSETPGLAPSNTTPPSDEVPPSRQAAPSNDNNESRREQRLREFCSLSDNNRLYATEQARLLCKGLRNQ